MIYSDVIKTYGPYKGRDNRLRIVLRLGNGKLKTVSYPKYLMEVHLNRYLTDDETVDHIDENPLNNDFENLRIISRKEHCYNDAIRNEDILVTCAYCGKEFVVKGSNIHSRNRKDKNQSGYFCSKKCTGKYGADIQNRKILHKIVEQAEVKKFKYHKN